MSFTRSQLKELANGRTERRASKLNLDSEILLAVQDICQNRKWWWRRKIVQFNTEASTFEYDLSTKSASDWQQFEYVSIYDSTGSCVGTIEPEFDTREQDRAIVLSSKQAGKPARYFMKPGAYRTMVVTPTPSEIWTILGSYWAVPDSTPDAQSEDIPLIPVHFQSALLSRLEMRINKFLINENPRPYQTSVTEYAEQIAQAAIYEQFAEGRVRRSEPGAHGDAVQST